MNRVELLAPAGNAECLETAFYFGADAAYISGTSFGLRSFAQNFPPDKMEAAVNFARGLGKKLYITVNATLYNAEIPNLKTYLQFLSRLGVDAVIVSDPAVLQLMKEENIALPVHISTQANTANYMAARFWQQQGASRVVLSREVSLREIAKMSPMLGGGPELEVFVHGAMCIAYSGRCLLSSCFTGRSGNRGECAQPCRWEYHISEQGYAGEYFPILEDDKGTYLLNSKDLMMIDHLPALIEAGVSSLKIEGRMKSAYYVASTVSAYRRALDAYYESPENYVFDEGLREELQKSATRQFTTGFFFGNPREKGQDTARTEQSRQYVFAGKVLGAQKDGYINVEQRNKFSVGDVLEVLSPRINGVSFEVTEILSENGEPQESAPHPQQKLKIKCELPLLPGDILRRQD